MRAYYMYHKFDLISLHFHILVNGRLADLKNSNATRGTVTSRSQKPLHQTTEAEESATAQDFAYLGSRVVPLLATELFGRLAIGHRIRRQLSLYAFDITLRR